MLTTEDASCFLSSCSSSSSGGGFAGGGGRSLYNFEKNTHQCLISNSFLMQP